MTDDTALPPDGEPEPLPDALRAQLTELPRAIEPARDLWPGIAPRLAPRRRRPWWNEPRWLLVAATLLVIGSSVGTWGALRRGRAGRALADASAARADTTAAPAPLASERAADRELGGTLDRLAGRVPDSTLAVLRRAAAAADTAIAQTERALQARPADPYLQEFARAAYQRKLALLRRAASLGMTRS
ncbi:MAG: hypothetical protein NW201_11630 [Gemmatimonadales bacterium]|nr:hypothetical protein [Gemmatimonadales bacterium]